MSSFSDATDNALAFERQDAAVQVADSRSAASDALELAADLRDVNEKLVAKLAAKDAEIAALTARVAELEAQTPEPPPVDPPEPVYPGPLWGSTSKADSFTALDAKLAKAAGVAGPVLMFDHVYAGSGMPAAIDPDLAASGRRYGMENVLNIRGVLANRSGVAANVRSYAASIPAGMTVYMPIHHEPAGKSTPAQLWDDWLFVARVIWAVPASAFKPGAALVPMLNFHGRSFDGRGVSGAPDGPAWAPPTSMTVAEKAKCVATVNGYSTGDVAKYDSPAEVFGPGWSMLASWGFTRLGACEFGYYPRTSGQYVYDLDKLARDSTADPANDAEVEVISAFHSDVGSNSPNGTWALDTPQSLAAYANVALSGDRS